jgi:hypothetical protein
MGGKLACSCHMVGVLLALRTNPKVCVFYYLRILTDLNIGIHQVLLTTCSLIRSRTKTVDIIHSRIFGNHAAGSNRWRPSRSCI